MAADLVYILAGPGLAVIMGLCCAGLGLRSLLFLYRLHQSRLTRDGGRSRERHPLKLLARSFLPFHRGRAPAYALVRYVFHLCLFLVPLFETGHIVLVKSSLGIHWHAFPAWLIDAGTLTVIGTGIWFLARRRFNPAIRNASGPGDIGVILVSVLPFATGSAYAHDLSGGSAAVRQVLLLMHLATGSLMLLMITGLFVRTRISRDACVGCAACTENCPTGTLEAVTRDNCRIFLYSHYQCICCGACRAACPEQAAGLRHEFGLSHFLAFPGKQTIGEKTLMQCAACQSFFAPDRQLMTIRSRIESQGQTVPETLNLCTRCKNLRPASPIL